jgi:hypothetical protein
MMLHLCRNWQRKISEVGCSAANEVGDELLELINPLEILVYKVSVCLTCSSYNGVCTSWTLFGIFGSFGAGVLRT